MQSMGIKTPKKIYLAHTKGFCAGVSTALKTVELALEKYGTPLYVRHHIVHNTAVIKQLETRGVVFIEELKDVPTVAGSLREALDALDKDREFLKRGDVFSDDQIDAYIELKMEEVHRLEHTPAPIEFDMYYSV